MTTLDQTDDRVPVGHVGFCVLLNLPDGQSWIGLGRSKKAAQHHAAAACLATTKNIQMPLPEGAGVYTNANKAPPQAAATLGAQQMSMSQSIPESIPEVNSRGVDSLKLFHEYHPNFVEEYREEGNTKDKIFIATGQIIDRSGIEQKYEGRGRSKKQAKRDLANRILRQVLFIMSHSL